MEILKITDLENEYRGIYAKSLLIKTDTKKNILLLRKLLIKKIKTYAVQVVNLQRNDNDLVYKTCDLALDLGMIQVIQDRLDKNYRYEGKYFCHLEKTCEDDFLDVNSEDIELVNDYGEPVGIKPFLEGFRLTQLSKGQTIDLFLYINKENGNKHVKYQPGFLTKMKKNKDDLYEVIIETYGHYTIDKLFEKLMKAYERKGATYSIKTI